MKPALVCFALLTPNELWHGRAAVLNCLPAYSIHGQPPQPPPGLITQ